VALLTLLVALPGCQALLTETTSTLGGIAGASIASGVGADPAVTTGIGLGMQALGRAGLQYAQRRTHRAEQDRIAAAAGPLPVGGTAAWRTNHTVPVEPNEHGQVAVSRLISTGPLDCKEIVFSVEEDGTPVEFYVGTICRNKDGWQWAVSEPSVHRWGSLQ
jgi:surface antigen